MNSQLKFEIKELRQQNIQNLLGAIGLIMTSLIVASLLPQLLLQYVYTDQAALMGGKAPFWLENGSMVIFILGVLYFLYTAFVTIMNSRKIAMLKNQMAMIGDDGSFSSSEVAAQEKELAALERMVDEALDEGKKPAKSARKKTSRSSRK